MNTTTDKIKVLPVDKKHTDYILGCVGEEQTLIRLRNKFELKNLKIFFTHSIIISKMMKAI